MGERFLTSDQMESGTKVPSWDQKMPIFVASDPELSGLPMIDLADGKSLNSQIGLNFNAVLQNPGDAAPLNLLGRIGTVVAVYGSKFGGGDFLGGGRNAGTGDPKELWRRSRSNTFSTKSADSVQVDYPSSILSTSYRPLSYGLARHFGHVSAPCDSGYAGQWEVLALCPTGNVTSATGIGMGGLDAYYHSGGMQIAEMIFFTEVLDKADVAKVERYLARKWFPARREDDGYNGRTSIGWYRAANKDASLTATFDVPANETLEIGKLQGGRKIGAIEPTVVKAGAGTLEVGDFADYAGTVEAQGGTVAFRKKPVPTVDQLADGLYVRFAADDPACLDLVTVNGTNFVGGLKNLASGVYKDKPVAARQSNVALRPWIREKGLGEKPVIDFGLGCEGTNGRILRWTTDESSDSYTGITLPSVYTVVALVGAQNGGGHIMNNMLQRSTRWCGGTKLIGDFSNSSQWNSFGLLEKENSYSGSPGYSIALNATNGTAFVNGRKHDVYTQGYETPSYQVAAWRVPGFGSTWLGGEDNDKGVHGQFRLGEILIWLRPLSDEEMLDAQAYLAKKWLGKTLAGYRDDAKNGVAQVQKLKVTGKTAIDVPADAAARIDKLTLEADLVKTGAGTLYVGRDAETKYNLVVKDGAVKVLEPQVTNQCQLAEGASLHFDASAASTLILWPKDGTNYVHRWIGTEGRGSACMSVDANLHLQNPWLDAENTLNGMPCVNFGAPSYDWGRSNPMMYLDRAHDGVRSVFVVCGSQNGGNEFFGGCSTVADSNTDSTPDWYCTASNGKRTALLASNANANIRNGEIVVDGVVTNRTANPDGWSLVEFHTLGGVMIASLNCRQQGTYNRGGNRFCEVVVYERELSKREKIATRNYLTRKWFPERELEALPEAVPEALASVKSYAADAGETNAVAGTVGELRELEGVGVLVKAGEQTLKVGDLSGFAGELDVQKGAVELTLPPATNETALVAEGRILHFDAQDASTLTHTVESTGSNVISRWTSKVGDIVAIPLRHPDTAATTNMPFFFPHDLNGYPVLSMYTEDGWNDRKCSMGLFDGEGNAVNVRNIRTAFWVLGSQEGGGLLFGGGYKAGETTDALSCWYRNTTTGSGQDGGGNFQQGLIGYLAVVAWPCLSSASYWVNEVKTPGYGTPNVLSGGYDIVAMRLKDGVADADAPNTTGLAMFNMDANYRNHRGHQRLGEVIAYDRVLSDEEMVQMQAYLKAKWGYTQKSPVNDATVNLAADATLTTAGNQYVGKLTGSGTVDGDVTAGALVAEVGAAGLTVDGTYTIAEGLTIELKGLSTVTGDLKDTVITVLTADAIAGLENRPTVVFTGDAVPEGYKAKLRTDNGKLTVTFKPKGMMLLVR